MQHHPIDDQQFLDRVREALRPAVPSARIMATMVDNAIRLAGLVPTDAERRAAVEAVQGVAGVCVISDEIEVETAESVQSGSAVLAAAVERRLAECPTVPDGVTAIVRNREVTLEGVVQWSYQSEAAQRIAADLVGGEERVHNNLLVSSLLEPRAVHARIVKALRREADREGDRILVEVCGGVVRLRGTVRAAAARSVVESAVRDIPGVTAVVDDLVPEVSEALMPGRAQRAPTERRAGSSESRARGRRTLARSAVPPHREA